MAITIFDNKLIEILEWLDIKTTYDIPITSFFLLTIKLVLGTSTLKDKTFGITENYGDVKCGLSG
jgi:hypothetical protein